MPFLTNTRVMLHYLNKERSSEIRKSLNIEPFLLRLETSQLGEGQSNVFSHEVLEILLKMTFN